MKNKIIVKIAHTGTGTHGMGATRWVSDFLLRIDLPQSLYYLFLRKSLAAGVAGGVLLGGAVGAGASSAYLVEQW